ncbi:hypothetical protein ABBQ38_014046 [Trebouxia sp. C0009 RCD-2024]
MCDSSLELVVCRNASLCIVKDDMLLPGLAYQPYMENGGLSHRRRRAKAIRALHASALVEHSDYVRQRVSQSVDLRGKSQGVDMQADSLRAYLEDSKGLTHTTFKDYQGWTVFHLLSKLATHHRHSWRHRECSLMTLLECQVKLSFTDAEGHTDWDCKSFDNDTVHVNLHLLPGLDVAAATAKVDGGWTALHIAAAKGERSVVRCLLGSGLFAVDDTDVQGMTAFQLALAGRRGGAMEALIHSSPGFKADAECRQVLTALVQEQATQGIDHQLSRTMLTRLSHYHDRAWCRPTRPQGRPKNAVLSGALADLPGNALAIITQQLDLGDLIKLDTATMAQVPVIRERLLQMRYAGRWLQLTRRMPAVARSLHIEEPDVESDDCSSVHSASGSDSQTDFDDSQTEADGSSDVEEDSQVYRHPGELSWKGRKQLWGQLQHMSKHSLLQTLLQQICHINDIATLVDNWVAADIVGWCVEMDKLGQWWRYIDKQYAPDHISGEVEPNRRLRQLYDKVVSAFCIGCVGFLDFDGHMGHPHNMASYPEFAAFAALEYPREFHNDLLLFCALHRLQQLPPKAVLVRLHSIFSRCCRYDLLLLTTCFAHHRSFADESMSSQAHADDMLTAFGAMNRCYTDVVAQLSASDKAKIEEHIHKLVDDWVNMDNIWNGRAFC